MSEENRTLHFITQTDRDYSALLEKGDIAIKFWLPELMGTILNECCSLLNTTRSNLIRQTLFTHLYGRYDWLGLHERQVPGYRLGPPSEVRFSKRFDPSVLEPEPPKLMQDMGKNTEDLKVWIPRKMKEDIQLLAQKADISISEMIREIIISTLIGHTYLATRKELMQMRIEIEEEGSE